MFTTSFKIDQSADWIKAQMEALHKSPHPFLKALKPHAPYYVVKRQKNLLTSPCAALAYVSAPQQEVQTVRVYFLPNILYILLFFCLIMSIYFNIQSYRHALMAYEIAANHPEIASQYPLPSFRWFRPLPMLCFLLFFGTIMYNEKTFIAKRLQEVFTP